MDWQRFVLALAVVSVLVMGAGCTDVEGDDYGDAPEEVQDGSLDYQDYKDAGCPYLGDSLDQETMEKCNEWIREQNATETSTTSTASE